MKLLTNEQVLCSVRLYKSYTTRISFGGPMLPSVLYDSERYVICCSKSDKAVAVQTFKVCVSIQIITEIFFTKEEFLSV